MASRPPGPSTSSPSREDLLREIESTRRRLARLEDDLRRVEGAPAPAPSDDRSIVSALLGNLPDFVYFKDAERRFVRASASFEALLGRPLDAILGRRDEDLFPPEIAVETREDDLRVLAGEHIVNKLEGGETQPGVEHWVLTTKLPWRDADGAIFGLFGMSRDVTDQKRLEDALRASEQRLRIISDTVPFPIAATRVADGVLVYANQALADLLGEPLEKLRGAPVPDYYADPAQRLSVIEQVQRDGRVDGVELRLRGHDGKVIVASSFILPLTIDGEPALMGAGADVTALKQREAELEEVMRQKEVLLREVNHRVRNNLATLMALVGQHQRRDTEPGVILDKLALSIRGLASAHSMLSDVSWGPLPLSSLCERVVGSVLGAAGVRFSVLVDDSDVTVSSQTAHHLALVVGELAANSIKHAVRGGSVEVTITVDEGPDGIVVRYGDDGPGFPDVVLRAEGPGFGLRLVKGLVVHSLEGEVELSNERGAVATLRLPSGRGELQELR